MSDTYRTAPRLAPSAGSLAAAHTALTSPRPTVRAHMRRRLASMATSVRQFLAPIEPFYAWGPFEIVRVDDRGEGTVPHFEADWLGLHLLIAIGRTPRASRSDEEAFAWAR